jgi:hypothetical protein
VRQFESAKSSPERPHRAPLGFRRTRRRLTRARRRSDAGESADSAHPSGAFAMIEHPRTIHMWRQSSFAGCAYARARWRPRSAHRSTRRRRRSSSSASSTRSFRPCRWAKAIEKAAVVQNLQPFLCGPNARHAPAEDPELAGRQVVDVDQQGHETKIPVALEALLRGRTAEPRGRDREQRVQAPAVAARRRACLNVTMRLLSSSHNFSVTARTPSQSESVGTSWSAGFSSWARCRL